MDDARRMACAAGTAAPAGRRLKRPRHARRPRKAPLQVKPQLPRAAGAHLIVRVRRVGACPDPAVEARAQIGRRPALPLPGRPWSVIDGRVAA